MHKGCNGPLNTGASLLRWAGLLPLVAVSYTTLQPLRDVSKQPTPVLSPGLSSALFSSPGLYQQMHIRLGSQGGGRDHLSLFCLPQTTTPPCEPLKLLFCPSSLPTGEGSS